MIYNIPTFIRARTPQGLRDAMLALAKRSAYKLRFFDIQFAQDQWTAWYVEEVKDEQVRAIRNVTSE